MSRTLQAAAVHLLTASGVIPAFLALIATAGQRFEEAFFWLGVAFIIDGIDGPLARRFETKRFVPRFCGERLDLIIDYVTYVVIPAYMIYQGGLAPDGWGGVAACWILLTSLYHFSDTESKTDDGYFVGFPAIWNLVAFYLFAVPASPALALAIIGALGALTFSPLKWLHPVRVKTLRPLTFGVLAIWAGAAIAAGISGFPAPASVQLVLILSGLYAVGLGFARSARAQALDNRSKR